MKSGRYLHYIWANACLCVNIESTLIRCNHKHMLAFNTRQYHNFLWYFPIYLYQCKSSLYVIDHGILSFQYHKSRSYSSNPLVTILGFKIKGSHRTASLNAWEMKWLEQPFSLNFKIPKVRTIEQKIVSIFFWMFDFFCSFNCRVIFQIN